MAVNKSGVCTIKNLIMTALQPVGKTMYIYGGGWNEEDTGSGAEAVTIGLSPKWQEFASKQTADYNHKNYDYKKDISLIHNGLDCSGFIGWVLYNTFNKESNLQGFVYKSTKIASNLAANGWGTLSKRGTFSDYKAGDILSSSCNDCAHVWLCVGQCDDGSAVLIHSSPPGVMVSGVYTPQGGKHSQAVSLADNFMKTHYPDWYNKFPDSSRDTSYLSHYDRFRWTLGKKLSDPEGFRNMRAEDILEELNINVD